jgi:hypothetical protein
MGKAWFAVGLILAAGCNSDGKTCSRGTWARNGECVPAPVECADGDLDVGGQCLPATITCATGTTLIDGVCVPDLACGDGTHPAGGICVPDVLPPPDIWEAATPTGEVGITLPAPGQSLSLGGVIDTPIDLDDDGWTDPDWDLFRFHASAGTWLRIEALSEGAALPSFRIVAAESDYERYSLGNTAARSVREVFLPHTGEYVLEVSDFNHVIRKLRREPVLPVGGDDFTWYVEISNLGVPDAIDANVLPQTTGGDLHEGELAFMRISPAPGAIAAATAAGRPDLDQWNDVIPILMVFDEFNNLLVEKTGQGTNGAAETLLGGKNGSSYLLVHDFWARLGPLRDYELRAELPEIVKCSLADCSSGTLPEKQTRLLRWDVDAGEVFVAGIYLYYSMQAVKTLLVDADLQPLMEDTLAYHPTNASLFGYADLDSRVYVWVREYEGRALDTEYTVEAETITTPALVPGQDYTGLPVRDMPPYTFVPAGISHFQASAGQVVFFYDLATHGAWTSPREMLMTPRLEPIGPVIDVHAWNFPNGEITPPIAHIPADGHYLHMVIDSPAPLDGTYDVRPRVYDPTPLGAPTPSSPVGVNTQGLGGGFSFYAVEGDTMEWLDIEVSPTLFSGLVPKVWVFNFGAPEFVWVSYQWRADPEALQMGLVRGGQASSSNPLSLSYVSPYDGKSLILVMDAEGSAGFLDTFNIEVSARPRPSNDTCQTARPINLGVFSESVAGASNATSYLDGVPFTARGPDRFYAVTLAECDILHASAIADWDARLYLLADCADPDRSWVAYDDPYEEGSELTYVVPPGGGGTYVLAVDAGSVSDEFLDADGDFTLHTSIAAN